MASKIVKIPLVIVTFIFSLSMLGCTTAESECRTAAKKPENRQVVLSMGEEEYIEMCIKSVENLCESGAFDC